MTFRKGVTGTALEITLEVLSLFNRLERHVNLDLPRNESGSMRALPGVVVHESLAEVRSMTDVTLARMTQALDHVCVEHGLPSIAWNPDRGKSSFAKPMEDILRLASSHILDSKRRMVESVGNAPTSPCLQGKCPAERDLPRPQNENGRLPPSFGDSAACRRAASANWCGCRELHPGMRHGGRSRKAGLLNHSREN